MKILSDIFRTSLIFFCPNEINQIIILTLLLENFVLPLILMKKYYDSGNLWHFRSRIIYKYKVKLVNVRFKSSILFSKQGPVKSL